jgi:hypothetical protein
MAAGRILSDLYNCESSSELLLRIINSNIQKKFGQDGTEHSPDVNNALDKIKSVIQKNRNSLQILLRGIKKSNLKAKLTGKLNSNDSLYDGLFLVGEKAKNFLEKSSDIPHPIINIASIGKETASWIFDMYRELSVAPIDLEYFKDSHNKTHFCEAISNDASLVDYYLFGLHTNTSDILVNYVSTTSSPETAYYKQDNDKLVIFLWLPDNYNLYMNSDRLRVLSKKIGELKLPILQDSFFPMEREIAFKGFILPHFILAVHDFEEDTLVLNPALREHQDDWINDGLNINQERFSTFISTTRYKRFLYLNSNILFEETNR